MHPVYPRCGMKGIAARIIRRQASEKIRCNNTKARCIQPGERKKMKNLVWSYGSEGAAVSGMLAAAGTFLNWWVGGFDKMVRALITCMAIDFALGFLAAAKLRTIDSHVMFWGGVNKVLVLVFVGFGVVLDGIVGTPEPYIRTAIIWFYIGREGLSIVENYGKMGLPLPEFITAVLNQLKDKGEPE